MSGAPNTISDGQWRALQAKAVKANPERDKTGSPQATKDAKAGALQKSKAAQS